MEEYEKYCTHQLLPMPKMIFPFPGVGNCSTCIPNPAENKNCSGYNPIRVCIINAKKENILEKISKD